MKQPWQNSHNAMHQQRMQHQQHQIHKNMSHQMHEAAQGTARIQDQEGRRYAEERRRRWSRKKEESQRKRQPTWERQSGKLKVDPFAQLKVHAEHLRADYGAERINADQLQTGLDELRLQDEAGTWWTIDSDSRGWLRHDGQNWVPDTPPQPTYGNVQAQPTRRWLWVLFWLIVIVGVVALLLQALNIHITLQMI